MVRTITLILTIAVAGGTSVQPQGSGAAAVDLQGKLYRSVFSSGSGVLAPAVTPIESFPAESHPWAVTTDPDFGSL